MSLLTVLSTRANTIVDDLSFTDFLDVNKRQDDSCSIAIVMAVDVRFVVLGIGWSCNWQCLDSYRYCYNWCGLLWRLLWRIIRCQTFAIITRQVDCTDNRVIVVAVTPTSLRDVSWFRSPREASVYGIYQYLSQSLVSLRM